MKYGFAGDREISVKILELLISLDYRPSFLLVSESENATHTDKLIEVSQLDSSRIFTNKDLKSKDFIEKIKKFEVDYIFGIHYPFIISKELINFPKVGFLNLHPAYLPYNKGWHTPSWAIYEGTKYGATLHFMSEKLDEGDIIHQREVTILPEDTANSLYKRVLDLEYEVFKEAVPQLVSLAPNKVKQIEEGTEHKKTDLENIREISLSEEIKAGDLINKIRALTTNNSDEAAFFVVDGVRYNIQVRIIKE